MEMLLRSRGETMDNIPEHELSAGGDTVAVKVLSFTLLRGQNTALG